MRHRTIKPEDMFRLQLLLQAQLSPDGKMVANVVTRVDTKTDKDQFAIWLLSLQSGEARQLTTGTASEWNPQWSPDGNQIAFISTRGGPPQVYVSPVDGGEARPLTFLKRGVGGVPLWSPDGNQIAFAASAKDEARDPRKPYRITRFIHRVDGMGNVDDGIQDIYVTNTKGGEVKRLTEGPYDKSPIAWSPDGQELLFTASLFPDSSDTHPRLWSVDLKGEIRELVDTWCWSITAAWTPDGTRIVYILPQADALDGAKADLWIIDRSGGEPECRTASLNANVGNSLSSDIPTPGGTSILFDEGGNNAFVRVQDKGFVHIYRVGLAGEESWERVATRKHSSFLLGGNNDQLLYAISDFDRPAELFISRVDGANERQLTHLNDDLLAQRQMASVEHLLFPSIDEVQVEGWILKPPVGSPPYPTILFSHSGPHNALGHKFHFELQMLAGAGYAALVVNFRGSVGYGTEFGTSINGDWGNLDYQDSMAAVDYVVARGIADPDRLGCCGFSFGGYLTCWIVGQTNRFKAAVAENPITNLVSLYGTSQNGPGSWVREMGGRPHEIPDVYRRCSPITYAHRCKTPTLIVQGEADLNCSPEQGEQFYTVLKANGCTVEMLRMPNMSHEGSKSGPPIVRRAQNEALIDWMNRYVRGSEAR